MKKNIKKIKKAIKNSSPITIVVALLFLMAGVFGGIFTYNQITKDDCFKLNGEKEIYIEIGEEFTYEDEGAKCVSFGKNLSENVIIYETNLIALSDGGYTLNSEEEGEYYIIYRVDSFKYKNLQRVRLFKVGGEQDGE